MNNQENPNIAGPILLAAGAGAFVGAMISRAVNHCRCSRCHRPKLVRHDCTMCSKPICEDCCRYTPDAHYKGATIEQGHTCSLECDEKQKIELRERKADIDYDIELTKKARRVELFPRGYRGKSAHTPVFDQQISSGWYYDSYEAEVELQYIAAEFGAVKVCFMATERMDVDPRTHGQSGMYQAHGII